LDLQGISDGIGANKRLLKANQNNKKQVKSAWDMGQLRETHIQRSLVTFRYKKYLRPSPVGLRGISDGLVTINLGYEPRIKNHSSFCFQVRYPPDIASLNSKINLDFQTKVKPSSMSERL